MAEPASLHGLKGELVARANKAADRKREPWVAFFPFVSDLVRERSDAYRHCISELWRWGKKIEDSGLLTITEDERRLVMQTASRLERRYGTVGARELAAEYYERSHDMFMSIFTPPSSPAKLFYDVVEFERTTEWVNRKRDGEVKTLSWAQRNNLRKQLFERFSKARPIVQIMVMPEAQDLLNRIDAADEYTTPYFNPKKGMQLIGITKEKRVAGSSALHDEMLQWLDYFDGKNYEIVGRGRLLQSYENWDMKTLEKFVRAYFENYPNGRAPEGRNMKRLARLYANIASELERIRGSCDDTRWLAQKAHQLWLNRNEAEKLEREARSMLSIAEKETDYCRRLGRDRFFGALFKREIKEINAALFDSASALVEIERLGRYPGSRKLHARMMVLKYYFHSGNDREGSIIVRDATTDLGIWPSSNKHGEEFMKKRRFVHKYFKHWPNGYAPAEGNVGELYERFVKINSELTEMRNEANSTKAMIAKAQNMAIEGSSSGGMPEIEAKRAEIAQKIGEAETRLVGIEHKARPYCENLQKDEFMAIMAAGKVKYLLEVVARSREQFQRTIGEAHHMGVLYKNREKTGEKSK